MIKQSTFILIFLLLQCGSDLSKAQINPDTGEIAIKQSLLDLSNDGVLMCLAAHPGDEDGQTLAYYRKKFGVKTYSVFYTRGEGGENETGSELYKELGVIRTREAENAARILGTDPYFLNFIDFGYCKTAAETFEKWGGKDSVLARVVYIIRKLKPDVIITNHLSDPMNGMNHGNHQVVALTALEAFEKAGDSSYHPEQFNEYGMKPWRVKKLFFRVFEDSAIKQGKYDVANAVGEIDSLRGVSYVDVANAALREHKSQGMAHHVVRPDPMLKTYYRLMKSDQKCGNDTNNLFGGILLTSSHYRSLKKKIAELAKMNLTNRNAMLRRISAMMKEMDVELSRTGIFFKQINDIFEYRLLINSKTELETLRNHLLGAHVFFTISDSVVVPGQVFYFTIDSISGLSQGITRLYFPNVKNGWLVLNDIKNEGSLQYKPKEQISIVVGKNQPLTLPKAEKQYLTYHTEKLFKFFVVHQSKDTLHSFNYYGEISLEIGPRVVFSISPKNVKVNHKRTFQIKIIDYLHDPAGDSVFVAAQGLGKAEPILVRVAKKYDVGIGKMQFYFASNVTNGEHKLVFDLGNRHIITDTVTVKKFPVEVAPRLKVGLIKSYDNTLEFALGELAVDYKILHADDLSSSDLSVYHTIIVDIRAYLVRKDLRQNNARLLDYVKNGGNLIVMYQRVIEWEPEYAPYPLKLTHNSVTDETAPVKILHPEHPLFTFPNQISDNDWKNWIQERGLCFPGEHSPEYVELLSTNDPGESPLTTGYLVANYGKGTYIYTSYSWYRQLREINPGTFRIFSNMISLPMYRK